MIESDILKVILIREHYRSRGWDQPMSSHELVAIMHDLKCGPEVIAAHLMMKPGRLKRMILNGEIPANVALPIRLIQQTLLNGKASPAPL